MHLLVRETRGLDEAEDAVDLGQSRADLVFLSFSDSDLGALAASWSAQGEAAPSLRLANLSRLRHPMSVDLYVEQVIAGARCVVIRLLGGLDYWRYGAEEIAHAARAQGIPLALLPGDGREDARLAELSTVDGATLARLDAFFAAGGPENMRRALDLMAHLAGLAPDDGLSAEPVPMHGVHRLDVPEVPGRSLAAIVFYRAYLLAADLAPIEALARALDREGLNVRALYVASLKDRDTGNFVSATLRDWAPRVVLNATAFSARLDDAPSPLEAAGAPILQVVFAGSSREAWQDSPRGLSQSDLAMQVVLPELDGRLLTTAISFKAEESEVAGLEFARVAHQPAAEGIAAAARSASLWARLATTPRSERKLALVLSDYPGAAGQAAHAVGLDAIASTAEILQLLKGEGFDVGDALPDNASLVAALCDAEPAPFLSLADYQRLFAKLDPQARAKIVAAWGAPDADPSVSDGHFTMRFARYGRLIAAIQPDRGNALDRKSSYHDPRPAAAPRLRRLLSLAARNRAHPRHDPSRHAWHARMAARQGDGAVVVLPACRAARRAPGHLSLHRQQSRRGGCCQAQARRRHHRPSHAAAEIGRPRQRHAGARAPHRRIRRGRRTRPPPHGASARGDSRPRRSGRTARRKRRRPRLEQAGPARPPRRLSL